VNLDPQKIKTTKKIIIAYLTRKYSIKRKAIKKIKV